MPPIAVCARAPSPRVYAVYLDYERESMVIAPSWGIVGLAQAVAA